MKESLEESEWLELETKERSKTITPDEFRWLCYLRGVVDQNKVNALLHPSIPQKEVKKLGPRS